MSSMHHLLKDTLKGNLSYGVCWTSVFGIGAKEKRTGVRFLLLDLYLY
jgi:hypothetical protein